MLSTRSAYSITKQGRSWRSSVYHVRVTTWRHGLGGRWFVPLLAATLALPYAPARLLGAPAASPPAQSTALPPAPASLASAQALVDANNLPAAEAAARDYLGGHAASVDGRYLLAFILFRENKPAASLAEYNRAAALQPPSAQQLKIVAFDYVLANDFADADKWMTTASAWAPGDSDAWYSLGRIKYSENRFAEAIDCFTKALALSPKLVKAENNMGLAYEGLNRIDEAVAAYRQAIAWQAGSAVQSEQPLLNLGTVLTDRNQAAEAQPLLEQAVLLAPEDPKIRVALGRLYQRQGQLGDAQRELEHAVALSPKTAAYHFQLGQVYRQSGLIDKAKTEFAQAAALDGTHSSD